jgi:hypothetical protein
MPIEDASIPRGWLCPRCGRVWAPHVDFCDCKNSTKQSGGAVISCPGEWTLTQLQPIWRGPHRQVGPTSID